MFVASFTYLALIDWLIEGQVMLDNRFFPTRFERASRRWRRAVLRQRCSRWGYSPKPTATTSRRSLVEHEHRLVHHSHTRAEQVQNR
jgi:hypothetical protein